jgi:hypothetical protein
VSVTILRPKWAEPIIAPAEYDGSQVVSSFQPGVKPIRWWVSAKDARRIAERMACWQCLTPFPCPPCPENFRRFKREAPEMLDWHPTIPRIGESRIKAYCCPMCDSDCSPAMVSTQVRFTPGGPKVPGGPNYITDADRDLLAKREAAVADATIKAPRR